MKAYWLLAQFHEQLAKFIILAAIGGHNPRGSEPPVSSKAGRNPQDITLFRIRTQCTMSFSVTGKGVLKAKFQD